LAAVAPPPPVGGAAPSWKQAASFAPGLTEVGFAVPDVPSLPAADKLPSEADLVRLAGEAGSPVSSGVIAPAASPIHLGGDDDLPVNARLNFRLKSEQPSVFGKGEKVEVASADGFYHTELSMENGGLMRQNAHTVMAKLEIPSDFGASSFGALRFRPITAEGYEGDWQPLATLVRLPELTELHCPASKDEPCALSGNNLFLIESIASDSGFQHSASINENAMTASIEVPRPKGKLLYLKLRDDPSVVHTLEMPVKKDAPAVHKEAAPKEEKPAASVEKSATPFAAAEGESSQ